EMQNDRPSWECLENERRVNDLPRQEASRAPSRARRVPVLPTCGCFIICNKINSLYGDVRGPLGHQVTNRMDANRSVSERKAPLLVASDHASTSRSRYRAELIVRAYAHTLPYRWSPLGRVQAVK